jgi:hypothetical protein
MTESYSTQKFVTIENICPDFFAFWEQAKASSFEEQLQLWKSLYQARHPEILESYYRDFLPLTQEPERVQRAFQQFSEVVPRMKEWAKSIEPLIIGATVRSASLFDMPDTILPYVVMVGWFISDGWSTSAYQGKRTSFVALEFISRKYASEESEYLEILLTHEAAHSHHYLCNASTWREYHIGEALFLEGLAVLASARAFPGASETELLWFHTGYQEWLKGCEDHWLALREQLLKDFDTTEPACYSQYFQGPQKGPFPLRSGYFAGYRAVLALSQRYSLIEMAHWNLIFAAEELRRVLQEA